MRSIRRDLLTALLAALAAASVLAAIATYLSAREEVDALLDEELRQVALSLRDHAQLDITRLTRGADDPQLRVLVQIWDPAFEQPYTSLDTTPLPRLTTEGFSSLQHDGRRWRAYMTRSGRQTIITAQPTAVRAELAARTALRLLAPVLLMLPVLGVLGWWIVGRGLAPLERIASTLSQRHPTSLEPVTERAPSEVQPLVDALNALLGRLDRAFDAQRRFAADAAHELRTPLTALTLQVQLAERAPDQAERAQALERLRQGVQRATRLVEQLLTLARLDPNAASRPPVAVDLALEAASVVDELLPAARAKEIDIGVDAAPGAVVTGQQEALRILVSNLVDNATRYTPARGRVEVRVRREADTVRLIVSDNGPGIAADERERVFDRFYRGSASEGIGGSGLGLALVRQIAELHGAAIRLGEAAGGGLAVTVEFPAVARPAL